MTDKDPAAGSIERDRQVPFQGSEVYRLDH